MALQWFHQPGWRSSLARRQLELGPGFAASCRPSASQPGVWLPDCSMHVASRSGWIQSVDHARGDYATPLVDSSGDSKRTTKIPPPAGNTGDLLHLTPSHLDQSTLLLYTNSPTLALQIFPYFSKMPAFTYPPFSLNLSIPLLFPSVDLPLASHPPPQLSSARVGVVWGNLL